MRGMLWQYAGYHMHRRYIGCGGAFACTLSWHNASSACPESLCMRPIHTLNMLGWPRVMRHFPCMKLVAESAHGMGRARWARSGGEKRCSVCVHTHTWADKHTMSMHAWTLARAMSACMPGHTKHLACIVGQARHARRMCATRTHTHNSACMPARSSTAPGTYVCHTATQCYNTCTCT